MHIQRLTIEYRLRYQQATVKRFEGFDSAFVYMDRETLWRNLAADGKLPNLPLGRPYKASSKTQVRIVLLAREIRRFAP